MTARVDDPRRRPRLTEVLGLREECEVGERGGVQIGFDTHVGPDQDIPYRVRVARQLWIRRHRFFVVKELEVVIGHRQGNASRRVAVQALGVHPVCAAVVRHSRANGIPVLAWALIEGERHSVGRSSLWVTWHARPERHPRV